jgi:hypothetical protein
VHALLDRVPDGVNLYAPTHFDVKASNESGTIADVFLPGHCLEIPYGRDPWWFQHEEIKRYGQRLQFLLKTYPRDYNEQAKRTIQQTNLPKELTAIIYQFFAVLYE